MFIELILANGQTRSYEPEGAHVVVGSSPSADVVIKEAPEIAPMHLLLAPRRAGVWVSPARDAPVAPTLIGRVLANELIPWGSEIDVGSICLRLREQAPAAEARSRKGNKKNRQLLFTVLLVMGSAAMLLGDEQDEVPSTDAPPPALFESLPAQCPDPEHAVDRGRDLEQRGRAKAERYLFSVEDGIGAVSMLHAAERCYLAANDSDAAKRTGMAREELEARIADDYLLQRMELEHLRDTKQWKRVMSASRQMQRFVAHVGGSYQSWLVQLERYAQTREEAAKKEQNTL